MANAQYSSTSPYKQTPLFGRFLDIAQIPAISRTLEDVLFTVNKTYQFRPDLLAFDLYGDQGYWWVFAVRNPNSIRDPVFDMRIGTKIYIPKKDVILALGR